MYFILIPPDFPVFPSLASLPRWPGSRAHDADAAAGPGTSRRHRHRLSDAFPSPPPLSQELLTYAAREVESTVVQSNYCLFLREILLRQLFEICYSPGYNSIIVIGEKGSSRARALPRGMIQYFPPNLYKCPFKLKGNLIPGTLKKYLKLTKTLQWSISILCASLRVRERRVTNHTPSESYQNYMFPS